MNFPHLRAARIATSCVFLTCGIGMSSWAPMVPYAKSRLALDDASLGLILLALGGGAMLTMPLSGVFINRFGSRAVMLAAIFIFSLPLPVLATTTSPWVLAVFLFIFGGGIGAVDVAMNAQAVVVEKKLGRPVMSSLHGLYSVGGLIGALGLSLLLDRGVALFLCALGVMVLNIGIGLWQFGKLLPHSEDAKVDGAVLVLPRGPVVLFGILCFITFLAEGALLDWSAVYLKFSRGFEESDAGVGYAIFSLAMAVGRLTGDFVTSRLGPFATVRYGAFLGAIGYFVTVGVPGDFSLVGFGLIGLGVANVVPILFSATGRLTDPPPSISIPAITTMGYAGLLSGPALIGFVAEATSLTLALGLIGVALLGVSASARLVHSRPR